MTKPKEIESYLTNGKGYKVKDVVTESGIWFVLFFVGGMTFAATVGMIQGLDVFIVCVLGLSFGVWLINKLKIALRTIAKDLS